MAPLSRRDFLFIADERNAVLMLSLSSVRRLSIRGESIGTASKFGLMQTVASLRQDAVQHELVSSGEGAESVPNFGPHRCDRRDRISA